MYPFDPLGLGDVVAIDSKVTSSGLFKSGLASVAISSPTYDQQPVFKFSTTLLPNLTHVGLPDAWAFPWVNVTWQ